jgi:2-polyprenyl-3-methyl-5-hydroxy-6-metoxy-1,4-benzoquinol methylase
MTCAAERLESGSGMRDMSPSLDALSLKFVLYARSVRLETLDAGCGDGLATAAALERGGYVVAMDPDSSNLERLRARVPAEQHTRLQTIQGRLPSVDFDRERFAGVHAAHVLQHLSDDERDRSLRKIHGWLKAHGSLFVSVVDRSSRHWELLLGRAGFEIEEVSTYPLPWNEGQLCVAIVATRPA